MGFNDPQSRGGWLPAQGSSDAGLSNSVSGPAVLLLADDLTGACDSGSAFAKAGFSVSVRFSEPGSGKIIASDVLAISVETRNLSPSAAGVRFGAMEFLRDFRGPLLFQKVDSAGRGHPGEEMLAIAAMTRRGTIVYAPAFPAAGRTVRDGILRIRDFTGQGKEIDLCELIPAVAKERVQWIPAGREQDLHSRMVAAQAQGKDIWLCDACTQDDLVEIVHAALALPLRLLWAGSAGLAEAIASRWKIARRAGFPRVTIPPARGRTLVVCGTTHPVTAVQLSRLERHAVALSLDGDLRPSAFDCGVLQVDWTRATEDSFCKLWRRLHGSEYPPIRTLVLTGGDTAVYVLRSLRADELWLGGEVEPGIPWSVAEGGLADGCIVITKSGGFGMEDSLIKASRFANKGKR